MTEPDQSRDTPTGTGASPERRRRPRPALAPPGRRGNTLFPDQLRPPGPPATRFGRVIAQLREPRNWIPLGLMIGLAIVAAALFLHEPQRVDPAPPILTRLTVSSSRAGTSLFVQGHYAGEIGRDPREFTVDPGHLRLRLIRRDCRARDTTVDIRAGETLSIGPLDPACPAP